MYPSVKTITQRLSVSKEKAKEIRGLMEGDINPNDVERVFEVINEILGGYGVEQITDSQWDNYWCDGGLLYVNMGDAYSPTICYDTRKDQWIVCPWGDIVERNEKRFG
jgi:hypothetical protein